MRKMRRASTVAVMETADQHFGRRLARAIAATVGTNKELARRLGQDPGRITGWVGRDEPPRGDAVLRISRALGISTDWLATGEGEMRSPGADLQEIRAELARHREALERAGLLERAGSPLRAATESAKRLADPPSEGRPRKTG